MIVALTWCVISWSGPQDTLPIVPPFCHYPRGPLRDQTDKSMPCTCMPVCLLHACVRVHACVCMLCARACLCVCVPVCVLCACAHVHACVRVRACVHTCMDTCVAVCNLHTMTRFSPFTCQRPFPAAWLWHRCGFRFPLISQQANRKSNTLISVDLVQGKKVQMRILHYSAPREGEIYSKDLIMIVFGVGIARSNINHDVLTGAYETSS